MNAKTATPSAKSKPSRDRMPFRRYMKRYYQYYLMALIPIVFFIIFRYGPILGNIIAFRRYNLGQSIFGSQWVGLKYFQLMFSNPLFWRALKNSVVLAVSGLIISFPIPIIFALLLNELNHKGFKRTVQTISYMPRFLSTVVIIGMLQVMLSPDTGMANQILGALGISPIFFMNDAAWFRPLYIGSTIWQWTGWSAIIYLAALSGINVELYEAAMIDGAGRLKQTWHVTLPGILPTITTVLILNIGSLLQLGYEKALLMIQNAPSNLPVGDIIDTLVYRMGLANQGIVPNYSYAAAIGLFNAVVGVILMVSANAVSRKSTGYSLF